MRQFYTNIPKSWTQFERLQISFPRNKKFGKLTRIALLLTMSSKQKMPLDGEETSPESPPKYELATAPPAAGMYPNIQGGAPGSGVSHTQPAQQQIFAVQSNAPGVAFGPHPVMVMCPSCHAQKMTRIEYQNSMKTHLIATILFVATCCCCIPYCMNSCKNANHLCSNCGAYLGTYGA